VDNVAKVISEMLKRIMPGGSGDDDDGDALYVYNIYRAGKISL
jgi:hypothetical protein